MQTSIFRLSGLVICILLLSFAVFAAQAEKCTVTDPDTGMTAVLETIQADGKSALVIPAWADKTNLQFENSGTLNLEKTGYEFKPGYFYTVKRGNSSIKIAVASDIPQLFITLGDGYTVKFLAQSKDNRAYGGNAVLIRNGTATETELDRINARGNSSFKNTQKKSYMFKLSEKAELVEGAGSAKKWILTANDTHNLSGVTNYAAFRLYEMIGGSYALSQEYVDLYINGQYQGVYMLSEKVETGKNRVDITEPGNNDDETAVTRVVGSCGLFVSGETTFYTYGSSNYTAMGTLCEDVTTVLYSTAEEDASDPAIASGVRAYQYATGSTEKEAGGFILEIDFRFEDVASWIVTRRGACLAVSVPEYATKEQVQSIAIMVQGFEDALYSDTGFNSQGLHYSDYMDIESFSKLLAVNVFMSDVDAFKASTYFCADLENGSYTRMTAGPAWDFDYCELFTGVLLHHNVLDTKGEHSLMPEHPWIEQCFTKADILDCLYELWSGVMGEAAQTLYGTELPAFLESIGASDRINSRIWEDGRTGRSNGQNDIRGIGERINVWNKLLLSGSYLCGGHIDVTENGLSLTVNGKYTSVSWYMINADGSAVPAAENAGTEFTPYMSGRYIAVITGPNILYTRNRSIFGRSTLSMQTAPVEYTVSG